MNEQTPPPGPPKRSIPQNELDFNMQLTNPAWGKKELDAKTQESLTKTFYVVDEKGEIQRDAETGEPITHHEDDLWSRLGFLTRDFRLSNLNNKDYVWLTWWGDFAAATAQEGYKGSTAYCISQIAPRLELSQSRAGFLRNILNTLINRNVTISEDPHKKSLFGMGAKQK